MNGRRVIIAATAAAAAAVIGLIVLTGGVADANAKPDPLVFEDTTTASAFVDVDHNGAPDPGDSFIFREQAVRNGTVIEYNDSQCVVGFDDAYLCHVVVVIVGRGQVIVDGLVAAPGGVFPNDFDLAITGGTGEFARASGHAHVHHVSDDVAEDSLYLRG